MTESITKTLVSCFKLPSDKEGILDENISTSLDLVKEATNKLTSKCIKNNAEAKLIQLENASFVRQLVIFKILL